MAKHGTMDRPRFARAILLWWLFWHTDSRNRILKFLVTLIFKVKTTAGTRSLRSHEGTHFELWIELASLMRSFFGHYIDIYIVEIVNFNSRSPLFTPHKGDNPPAKLGECQMWPKVNSEHSYRSKKPNLEILGHPHFTSSDLLHNGWNICKV